MAVLLNLKGLPLGLAVLKPFLLARLQPCSLGDIVDKSGTLARALTSDEVQRAERTLILCAASCAGFCEHVEHIEPSNVRDVISAANDMRNLAAWLAAAEGLSLRESYANRIRGVEESSPHRFVDVGVEVLTGADALDRAATWEEIQIAQNLHDRQFHPDVFGLSKVEQVRHYTFHVTKLAGLLTKSIMEDTWAEFRDQRLPDIAIFGVKLATVCNELLPQFDADADQPPI